MQSYSYNVSKAAMLDIRHHDLTVHEVKDDMALHRMSITIPCSMDHTAVT